MTTGDVVAVVAFPGTVLLLVLLTLLTLLGGARL